jgi:hypothetical protein
MTAQQLKTRWWLLHRRVRRVPLRTRLGVVIGAVAVAGLIWQHTTSLDARSGDQQQPPAASSAAPTAPAPDQFGDNPDVEQLPAPTVAPQATSIDAARAVAWRFAKNFCSPNGNRDDWMARISADASEQLMEQYRLTDIRNLTQAAVTSLDGPLDELPGAVAFRATYSDASETEIRLALSADGWKVINVVPVTTDAAAG